MKLILASQSPYRKQLLNQLGFSFEARKPIFDEESYKTKKISPKKLAETLAELKARSLESQFPEDILIGSDQLVNFKGEVLGKPGSLEKAQKQLFKMSGKTHQLITSMCVLYKSKKYVSTVTTKLTMKKLTLKDCIQYVNQDNPIDCAGSYKIEKAGIALFKKIETEDFTSIQGLPLMSLIDILDNLKYPLPFFNRSTL